MITELSILFSTTIQAKAPDIFDELWNMPYEWIEPPNQRRGGWSGATRVRLRVEDGTEVPCILKKQQNHCYYSLKNGLIPRPTFEREARNLKYLRKVGIEVPEVLYYGRRKRFRCDQALLLIPELVGFQSLDSILNEDVSADRATRMAIAAAVGKMVRKLHHHAKWHHRNLYPKHIFVAITADKVDVCLIDLENACPLTRSKHLLNELRRLYRRAHKATILEQVTFMRSYCASHRLGATERRLIMSIVEAQ